VSTHPAFVFHPRYTCDLGPHVFPIQKYEMTHRALLATGLVAPEDWFEPTPAPREALLRVHTPEYLDDFFGLRWTWRTATSELPISREIVDAYVLGAGGTMLACEKAFERGFAANLGGGFHHAFADQAAGFCYLNDIAIGIRHLQAGGRIRRAAVLDCDLHQGNGTARIFQGDDTVFTFSIHQENNYPVKERSDLDIGLEDETGDAEYLAELERALPVVLERGRPDFVLYQAGADPYEHDVLGGLAITRQGLARRDKLVIEACAARKIPVAATFGGGYAEEVHDTVAIHTTTCLTLIDVAQSVAAR
jgi:acetoin utilization deacetylase AcuC-like enzyme